jgi:hypothetical protein
LTDERLAFVIERLWVAALEAASGLERRSSTGVESAASLLATIHGGSVMDWHPPLPQEARAVPPDGANR